MKEITYTKEARKSLRQMQPRRRAAILAKLEDYACGRRVDIKKLVGKPHFRIRVGQDRVVIDDLGQVVLVIEAGPRGGIYKE